jgi:pyrroloquinoline quinone biosynthesis protein B
LHIRVLGAAAGGGFPQWNSAGPGCSRARSGDPAARPSSQCSLAVSADGRHWVLLDASPDLRSQINDNPVLHPPRPPRSSPICAVILTSADIDRIAGLLTLRERHPFALWATPQVHRVLRANPIFDALDLAFVRRLEAPLDQPFAIQTAHGQSTGIQCTAFAVPGKVPLFLEQPGATTGRENTEDGDVVGLELRTGSSRFLYIPGCAALTDALSQRLRNAPLVFFDGTLWSDDELIASGAGAKTGQRMGHMSVSGSEGSMSALQDLGIARKIFIHINNSNPLLLADSPQRAIADRNGWQVAHDGMEIVL